MGQTAFGADSIGPMDMRPILPRDRRRKETRIRPTRDIPPNGHPEFRPYERDGDPDWLAGVVILPHEVDNLQRDRELPRAEHLAIVAAARAEIRRRNHGN